MGNNEKVKTSFTSLSNSTGLSGTQFSTINDPKGNPEKYKIIVI
jgi:hypothetical protein